LPIALNSTKPMTSTAAVAMMGESQPASREGSGRASSFK
jgi:hypothetical protein